MSDIRPIFVLGIQRSGTTWVANALGGHPSIAAVEAEDHNGVHESVFFSHFAREYGNLSEDGAFERFCADFTASDYFILTGLSEEWFRAARPRSYAEAFRLVMEEVARRRGCRFWLEKSPHHTLLSDELAEAFPDAFFVCVVRDPVTLIRSRLWAFGRVPPPYPARLAALMRSSAAVSLYQRHLASFCSRCDRAILLRYEEMREDAEAAMKRVLSFMGEDFDPSVTRRRYRANTSFPSPQDKERAFGCRDRVAIRLFSAVLRLVPLSALRAIEERRARRRGLDWPQWCWKRRPRPGALSGQRASST